MRVHFEWWYGSRNGKGITGGRSVEKYSVVHILIYEYHPPASQVEYRIETVTVLFE